MNDIDWSKAPEGTIGHAHSDFFGGASIWYKKNASGGLVYTVVGEPEDWLESHLIPTTVVWREPYVSNDWTGEGPPPVGVEAEAYFHADTNPDWLPFTLKYFSEEHVVFRGPIGECHMSRCAFDKYGFKFRPIRTPEQIAAEEREKAVGHMWSVWNANFEGHVKDGLYALYDSGYVKQVKP